MESSSLTQLGIAGATLAILFFIVRYFVTAMLKKDDIILALTDKFIKIAEENTEARVGLTQAINTNTKATESGTKHLSGLMNKILKRK